MVSTQVTILFTRAEPLSEERLDTFADACLEAVSQDARFLAFGPVVSVDYERPAVEVECTVCTETGDEAEIAQKMEAIRRVALNGLAEAEYTVTQQRVAVPA